MRLEECLRTCDAVAYLASQASNGSDWCQQEVGWGLGRGVPVVPVALGADPTAILGERQAVDGHDLSVAAEKVVRILMRNPATAMRAVDGLVHALGESRSFDVSNRIASCLRDAPVFNREQAKGVEAAISSNDQVANASFGALPDQLREIVAEKLEA